MSEEINTNDPVVGVVGNLRGNDANRNPPTNQKEASTSAMIDEEAKAPDASADATPKEPSKTPDESTPKQAVQPAKQTDDEEKPTSRDNKKDENPPFSATTTTEGNDQVTLDPPPKRPLVPSVSGKEKEGVSVKAAPSNSGSATTPRAEPPTKTIKGPPPTKSNEGSKPSATETRAIEGVSKTTETSVSRASKQSTGGGDRASKPTTSSTSSPGQPAISTRAASRLAASSVGSAVAKAANVSQSSAIQTKAPPLAEVSHRTTRSSTAAVTTSTITTRSAKLAPQSAAPISSLSPAPQFTTEQPVPPSVPVQNKELVEGFAPYVRPSDTSLEQARLRLQTALQQTYQLRRAFTERVHGKYRVCLYPPRSPQRFHEQMAQSPAATLQRLSHEMAAVQQEKDGEKKQASQLNNQVELLHANHQHASSSAAAQQQKQQISSATRDAASMWKQGTVDHAEQLMYFSAGLNLIILPEDETVSPEDLEGYTDRSPIHHITGQRAKNMSLAAATAGHVMLERKRKALALRLERQQQQQMLLLSSSSTKEPAANDGAPAATVAVPTTTNRPDDGAASKTKAATASKQTSARSKSKSSTKHSSRALAHRSNSTNSLTAAVAGKTGRSRAPAGLSAATLLNLNPAAEELVRHPETTTTAAAANAPAAATMAIIARGGVRVNAHSNKMTQQRLRHPHPESLGGRRRSSSMNRKDVPAGRSLASMPPPAPPEPFLQSYLQLTLPPLPAAKERLERRALPVVAAVESCSERAKNSVRSVLSHFQTEDGNEPRQMTRIELLHALNHVDRSRKEETKLPSAAASTPGTGNAAASAAAQKDKEQPVPPIDPILTFSVLHAVGLIGRAPTSGGEPSTFSLPSVDEKNTALWSPKLRSLHRAISSNSDRLSARLASEANDKQNGTSDGKRRSRTSSVDRSQDPDPKRQKVEHSNRVPVENIRGGGGSLPESEDPVPTDKADDRRKIPVEHIRGGGEALPESDEGQKVSEESVGVAKPSSRKGSDASEKSKGAPRSSRKGSDASARSPSRKGSDASDKSRASTAHSSQLPMHPPSMAASHSQSGVVGGYQNTLSTMQLAGHIQRPAEFLGGLQAPAGYDLTALGGIPGTGMVGYAIPDRTAAAHALLVREQQAAALLGTAPHAYQQPASSAFPRVGAHPAAVSALLSPHASSLYASGLAMNALGTQQASAFVAQQQQQQSTGKTNTKVEKDIDTKSLRKPENTIESKDADKKNTDAREHKVVSSGEKVSNHHTRTAPGAVNEPPNKSDRGDSKTVEKTSAGLTGNPGRMESRSGSSDQKPHAKQSAATASGAGLALPRQDVCTEPERKRSDELGMKYFVPKTPASISPEQAGLIRSGNFHRAAQGINDTAKLAALLGYLHQAGAAVPIQKALVSAPLKERLSAPSFKASGNNGAPQIPRDTVTSVLLLWLWANHEMNFQRAFEKSGRVDVDPDCRWVIQAAVDIAVRELGHSIAESTVRGQGVFAESATARKGQNLKPSPASSEEGREKVSKKVEIHTATVISRALTTNLCVDPYADRAVPQFESLVAYLDESRLGALRAKSQERVLLANLLSRKATMSESFSHAYVSAMVRAGEALGHGKLFETAQNEEVHASTMIPYDIFTDDSGAWEDPCQGNDAFPSGLTGEDLMRRAHARAMIQKSLRKLQDRHNIRGGAPNYGPYPENADKDSSKAVQGKTAGSGSSGSSRPTLKRRYSSISEPPVPPGTGSAKATTRAVYDPRHISDALDWPVHHIENKPYGRHRRGQRVRSLSLSLNARSGEPRSAKKARRSMSIPAPSDNLPAPSDSPEDTKLPKSSFEITWGDVAGIFSSVEIIPQSRRSSAKKAAAAESHHHSIVPADGKIIAPFCRKFAGEVESDSEESEEDTSDETVLANHQVILDDMKAKISAFYCGRECTHREQAERS